MALIDNQNKVIYWDEVNWQWIPFIIVSGKELKVRLPRRGSNTYVSINSKEEALDCLSKGGYSLHPLSTLGIIELTEGCYFYSGKVYKNENRVLTSLPSLLAKISGSHTAYVHRSLEGIGVLSESQLKKIVDNFQERRMVDHLGNKFRTVEEMAKHWGIFLRAYNKRRDRGWSLERILTTPVRGTPEAKECVDFKGNVFPSLQSMAKEYEVSHASILYHIRKGKTSAEALKHLLTEGKNKRKVTDHKGSSFSSNTEMAKYYNVNLDTFRDRIKRGWSLEEALTGKKK